MHIKNRGDRKGSRKMLKRFPACALILALVVTSTFSVIRFSVPTNAQALPNMSVDPPLTYAGTNSTFTINLNLTGGKDVCSWQAYIYYNNAILQGVSYFEGPFLSSHGSTLFDGSFNDQYNATFGQMWMWCVRAWSGYGVDGSGILANVTFQTIGSGNSTLSLADTVLGDSQANPITHTTNDGNVSVQEAIDVAVTSVTPLKTIVGQGYPMQINVTVSDQGDSSATFNVTTYANTTAIGTAQNISLMNGSSTIVTFTWNTTGWSMGNYTIWADAWPVSGNSTLVDGLVFVGIPGDLNHDGVVNVLDAIILSNAYLSTPSSSNWNPNADINNDDAVNILDAIVLANHFNEHFP